jgi:hypothetical protein
VGFVDRRSTAVVDTERRKIIVGGIKSIRRGERIAIAASVVSALALIKSN